MEVIEKENPSLENVLPKENQSNDIITETGENDVDNELTDLNIETHGIDVGYEEIPE